MSNLHRLEVVMSLSGHATTNLDCNKNAAVPLLAVAVITIAKYIDLPTENILEILLTEVPRLEDNIDKCVEVTGVDNE